jgi:hypothetical protein
MRDKASTGDVKMERPEVTLFIPNKEEKERLAELSSKVIGLIMENTKLDYEISFVLKELVEGFQEIHKCIIPIAPTNKLHILMKLK